jgi:hypothetical protein
MIVSLTGLLIEQRYQVPHTLLPQDICITSKTFSRLG